MLAALTDLPAGVIGFEGVGQIEATLVFADGEGVSSGGVREDLKLGVDHVTRWKRIALVTAG